MRNVSFMDTSAESSLEHIRKKMIEKQGILLISGIQHQPKEIFHQTGLYDRIGKQYFFTRTELALHFILQELERTKCKNSFQECATISDKPAQTKFDMKHSHVEIDM